MHLDPADAEVRKLSRLFVDGCYAMQRDTEFIFAFASRNVAVRAGVDVGIYAQRDRGPHPFFTSDPIDPVQLRFALHVETENSLVERILDLFPRFSDPGEGAFRRRAAGFQDTE